MQNIEAEALQANNVNQVHVAVAVIMKQGQVLISKRKQHVHQGGLWEFPGGKVEKNETLNTALFREIQEELGIHIIKSRPLIRLLHHYDDKSVLLDVQLITEFNGQEYERHQKPTLYGNELDQKEDVQFGLEGQIVKWVPLQQLDCYQFPEANQSILSAIKLPTTYLITPDCCGSESQDQFLQQFSKCIENNLLVQLRVQSINGEKLQAFVTKACDIAQQKQATLLLNSGMDVNESLYQMSHGLHLTSYHLHKKKFVDHFRDLFPKKWVSASCHNEDDIKRANEMDVDFVVASPVQSTQSHPQQMPLGWDNFKALTEQAKMPVFALGGMSQKNIFQAQLKGAQGISAIRSLWNTV